MAIERMTPEGTKADLATGWSVSYLTPSDGRFEFQKCVGPNTLRIETVLAPSLEDARHKLHERLAALKQD